MTNNKSYLGKSQPYGIGPVIKIFSVILPVFKSVNPLTIITLWFVSFKTLIIIPTSFSGLFTGRLLNAKQIGDFPEFKKS